MRDVRIASPRGQRAPRRAVLRRVGLVGALALTGVVALVPVAGADSTLPVPLSAEAWYRPLPIPVEPPPPPCLPVGCVIPPVSVPAANPYPPQTLHVGASGGAEEARTYLSLDTGAVPFGVDIVGGSLVLPVLTDPAAGTLAPETAALQVCPATSEVQDKVEGSVGGAPTVDCKTSSKAQFKPASGSTPALFTVDLAPFAQSIASGAASFAVLPVLETGASWHVAFSGRGREGGKPISAELLVPGGDDDDGDFGTDLPTVDVGSSAGGPAGAPPLGAGSTPGLSVDSPPLSAPQPPGVAPQRPGPTGVVPVAAVVEGPLEYAPLFLLPLLLAGMGLWVGRAYTRDLVRTRG